jgi:hypothetical protein
VTDEPRSEQTDDLELNQEPAELDPSTWEDEDPDYAANPGAERQGEQLQPPAGEPPGSDREATQIAQDAGPSHALGPEQQALHEEG